MKLNLILLNELIKLKINKNLIYIICNNIIFKFNLFKEKFYYLH